MHVSEQALVAGTIAALKKTMTDADAKFRPTMQQTLDDTGIERLAIKLPSGAKVGNITVSNPKPKATVTDEKKVTAWVAEQYPDEIAQVVRAAFLKKLLDEMNERGVAEIVTPQGEIVTVPGVEMQTNRAPSHSVTWDDNGIEALAAAWRNGELAHIEGLPALMRGGAA